MTKQKEKPMHFCRACGTKLVFASTFRRGICGKCAGEISSVQPTTLDDIDTDIDLLVNPTRKTRAPDSDSASGYINSED
jgi:hypothetical protein